MAGKLTPRDLGVEPLARSTRRQAASSRSGWVTAPRRSPGRRRTRNRRHPYPPPRDPSTFQRRSMVRSRRTSPSREIVPTTDPRIWPSASRSADAVKQMRSSVSAVASLKQSGTPPFPPGRTREGREARRRRDRGHPRASGRGRGARPLRPRCRRRTRCRGVAARAARREPPLLDVQPAEPERSIA